MTINLSTLLAVTFAVTGLACVGTLQAPKTPGSSLNQIQFAANCVAQGGRFTTGDHDVACKFAPPVEVSCVAAANLSNCRWTGPIEAQALDAMFGAGAQRS
jgi:hypothetical protein